MPLPPNVAPAPSKSPHQQLYEAIRLMDRFTERTGLTGAGSPVRYLWTDAFAVCNFLGLSRATGEARFSELALRLVDQVHTTLGHHRPDSGRTGWLSGPLGAASPAHPTRAGLRIGKKLPERLPDQRLDPELEWDRDGQYFHYLTRWMHALDQVARATGQVLFNRWARELAETAHAAFTIPSAGDRQRMVWKMNVDLSHPLVGSMGQHDPLDGFVTCAELDTTARALGASSGPDLECEATSFAAMADAAALVTTDPLGIGGLLSSAHTIGQLTGRGVLPRGNLLSAVLAAAQSGLEQPDWTEELERPAERRLAFRELGLAIGLAAIDRLESAVRSDPDRLSRPSDVRDHLHRLRRFGSLRPAIEWFWLDPDHRAATTWSEHRDINEVMLATCLAPDGYLVLDGLG